MAVEDIQQLIDLLAIAPDVTELTVKGASGAKVTVKRQLYSTAPVPSLVNSVEDAPAGGTEVEAEAATQQPRLSINASLVGLFHEANPPIYPGSTVVAGQIVGYIESMRLMNEVVSTVEGSVETAAASEGQPVEYGQLLFTVAGR
jgi:biotin carboxyl carrier protein